MRTAKRDLARICGDVEGKSFLDIGCGSGIHALAAHLLGADVLAVDVDPDSCKATRRTGRGLFPVEHRTVFDLEGQYDVVYSWGVLHHTGDMWRAIDKAASLVASGGILAIALYLETPLCGAWKVEKRLFNRAPRFLQNTAVFVFGWASAIARGLYGRRSPLAVIRDHGKARGMSSWHDVRDWLGGYPYESVTREAVIEHLSGFDLEYTCKTPVRSGVFGTGCGEMRFQKH